MKAEPRPPFNVVFMHVPKTAGTTLRRMFQARYGTGLYSGAVEPDQQSPYHRYIREETDTPPVPSVGNGPSMQRWQTLSREQQEAAFIFLGHFWYGLHHQLPGRSRYVTMLRDPVERALSLHAHRLAHQRMQIPVERYVTAGRDYEIANGQTRRLSFDGVNDRSDVTETMFDVACERLVDGSFAAVGVTERFDESIIAVAHALAWRSAAYESENLSTHRVQRTELPRPVLDCLIERNEFDLRLHEFAGEQLDKSLAGIDVPTALARLRRSNRIESVRKKAKLRVYRVKVVGSRAKRTAMRIAGS